MKHGAAPILPPEDDALLDSRAFDSRREDRLIRSAPGTLLIVHAVLAAVLQIGWTLLPDGTAGIVKSSFQGYIVAAALMQGLCILIPTLVIAGGYRITPRILLGRSAPRPGSIILAATAGIPMAVLLTGLNTLAVYGMSRAGFTLPNVVPSQWIAATDSRAFLAMLVMAVVLPGIVEELMFRGLIQGAMEHEGARISAILLPALAFALFHADPLFLLAPLGAGLLLGYLRQSTGSLFPPIAAHISLNLTLVAIRPLLPQWGDAMASPGTFDTNSLLTLSVVATVIALIAFAPVALAFGSSLFKKSTEPVRVSGTQPARRVFLEWRFLLGCLLLAAFLIWGYSFSLSLG